MEAVRAVTMMYPRVMMLMMMDMASMGIMLVVSSVVGIRELLSEVLSRAASF